MWSLSQASEVFIVEEVRFQIGGLGARVFREIGSGDEALDA